MVFPAGGMGFLENYFEQVRNGDETSYFVQLIKFSFLIVGDPF